MQLLIGKIQAKEEVENGANGDDIHARVDQESVEYELCPECLDMIVVSQRKYTVYETPQTSVGLEGGQYNH